MTAEEFNSLSEQSKRVTIFEADKIEEIKAESDKYELFIIDDFYVEVKTSQRNSFRRSIKTYKLHELPLNYSHIRLNLLKGKLKRIG